MIYGQIALIILLVGLCGACSFIALRAMEKTDAIQRDYSRVLNSLTNLQQQFDNLSAKVRDIDTENYLKLSARISSQGGELEEIGQRQKATVSALEQLNKRFASWDRTEARTRKNADKAPEGNDGDETSKAIQEALALGTAIPLPASNNQTPFRKPGQSLRSRVA